MILKKQICNALCEGFSVRKVPVGYAIKSPIDWFLGEPLTFYIREEMGRARLEDSGTLYADLQAMGVDFTSNNRRLALDSLLKEHATQFHEEEYLFISEWKPLNAIASIIPNYMAFLTRVQDLMFLNRDRVASTFREDLIAAVENRFKKLGKIEIGEAPIPSLPRYTVDIVVKTHNGKTLAIFPAVSELNSVEAILFSKELELEKVDNVIPFLVFEDFNSSKISQRTMARALNSNLSTAAWNGGKREVLDKIYNQSGLKDAV